MLAAAGPMPRGYFGDEKKSADTFRVIGGVRYTVPGDFATIADDGTVIYLQAEPGGRWIQRLRPGGGLENLNSVPLAPTAYYFTARVSPPADFRNFRRAGALKKRFLTSTVVPGRRGKSSTDRIRPPSTLRAVPTGSPASLVSNERRATAAMEGNATEPILKQFGSHETRGDFLIKVNE